MKGLLALNTYSAAVPSTSSPAQDTFLHYMGTAELTQSLLAYLTYYRFLPRIVASSCMQLS